MYRSRWGERFGFLPELEISRPVIWLHAVSVGEVEASTALINRLLRQYPQYQIIITTVTPTGAQTVQRHFASNVIHLYLPYDLPFSIRRFLWQLKPVLCVIMETELWPNLYYYCHKNQIPLVIANARMSLHSLNGYKKFAGLMRTTLSCVTRIIVQSKLDADRFISLGCDPDALSIASNLKYDIEMPSDMYEKAQSLRKELFPNQPVWIAASTHDNEESLVLEAYEMILAKYSDCILILAPRHPQRFDKVAELCIKQGFNTVRKSTNVACDDTTQIFLLDTLGELQLYYGCADVAFVGGSLVPAGGHNMLEPAAIGVPIISGVHVDNFQEISQLLQQAGAILFIRDTSELAGKVTLLLSDAKLRARMAKRGKTLIGENRGSTDQLMKILQSTLA